MNKGLPSRYAPASFSILRRCIARASVSSSSSEPTIPSLSQSADRGEQVSRESGEVDRRGGIWNGSDWRGGV